VTPVDPFDTGELRRKTLQTWQDNPARFREDANTEEDYARGYYRDRIIIELAQNAADAASELGGAVHFSLHLDPLAPCGWSLTAANTGHPLTRDGAASLSSLRTSAKRVREGEAEWLGGLELSGETQQAGATGRSIGHFGVGFSAVRAVSDDILLRSTTGGLRFSLDLTRAELAAHESNPDLAQEIARRGTELPILRLPWPADPHAADAQSALPQAATVITVRLRDETAVAQVRDLLAQVDDALLIGLPGLTEISVAIEGEAPRRIADLAERWHITRRAGDIPAELVATLPVEERERAGWHITWATPRTSPQQATSLLAAVEEDRRAHLTTQTLLAPTPTDEPVTLPGLLIVALPLEPTRRRVRPGPVTDWIIGQVGVVAAEHAREVPDPLALVPIGLPAGSIDRALHESLRTALSEAPLLRTITDEPVAPHEAAVIVLATGVQDSLAGATPVIDRDALQELASGQDGIVDIPRHRLAHAAAVGVQARHVADVITEMPAGRSPERWHQTYGALNALTREVGGLSALASLPVPLADKRVVSGPRGAFLISDDLPDAVLDRLTQWDLRIIAAGANHPLLESLGAVSATAGELLDEPAVRHTVAELRENILDLDEIAQAEDDIMAVLHLVASTVQYLPPGEPVIGPLRTWLPDLPLRNADEEHYGAGGLLLPGSAAEHLFTEGELQPLADDLAAQWDAQIWRAVGVRDQLLVVGGTVTLDAWDIDHSIDQAMENISLATLDLIDDYLAELADYWLEEWDPEPGETLTFELRSLADLDIIATSAWDEAQGLARKWLVENGAAVIVPGQSEPFPHYLHWWLEHHAD